MIKLNYLLFSYNSVLNIFDVQLSVNVCRCCGTRCVIAVTSTIL